MENLVKQILDNLEYVDFFHSPNYWEQDDITIGMYFHETFKNQYRFCSTAKNWYFYDGKSGVWKEDENHTIRKKEVSFVRAILIYAQGIKSAYDKKIAEQAKQTDSEPVDLMNDGESSMERDKKKLSEEGKRVKRFYSWAARLQSYGKRESLLKDAAAYGEFSKSDLDKDENLLNGKDAVFNLDTGEITPHSPTYLMSKSTNVEFYGKQNPDLWHNFMNTVMQGNQEMIAYLKMVFGSCLQMGNPLQECYFLWGQTTRNGKTSTLETLGYVLGNYATSADPLTFSQGGRYKDGSKPQPDVAALAGARFVRCPEPPKHMMLDAALLKRFTGANEIVARTLNEKPFSFTSRAKIFFDVNDRPQITDTTVFDSGRIVVIPYNKHLTELEQDVRLGEKLRSQDSVNAIFQWLYEGLQKSRTADLTKRPVPVIEAIRDYAKDSDKIGEFLGENFVKIDSKKCYNINVIYCMYDNWSRECGYTPVNKGVFMDELKSKRAWKKSGTVDGKTKRNVLVGYKLSENGEPFYRAAYRETQKDQLFQEYTGEPIYPD